MNPECHLLGERLRLRPFTPADAADVFAYAGDPNVTQHNGWVPHRSRLDSLAYIQRCRGADWKPVTFAVEWLERRRVIGVVDIRVVSRLLSVGEIGYTLARDCWGRGFNVEAGQLVVRYGFEEMRLRRIQAVCEIGNRRSYRTMEKLGMVLLHTLRGGGDPRDPESCTPDRLLYAIRRRVWRRDFRSESGREGRAPARRGLVVRQPA